MFRPMMTMVLIPICLAVMLVTPASVAAHQERPPQMPDGSGSVPTYRATDPDFLVCKTDKADFEQRIAAFPSDLQARNRALWDQCQRTGYRHLQQAVNQVTKSGATIAVLPGLYQEEPSQRPPSSYCANLPARYANLGYQILSFEQQLQCPNNQNLVAIFSKTNLQIEGTGASPTDVIFDASYNKLNAIRADRSNGLYLRNLTTQHTTFNGIYIMETDGFVLDDVVGRWTDEYGFLTFADDHGLYTGCEAYGNGDSGVYPGAANNINADRGFDVPRYAIEIKGCYSHNNALGYSGTAGDSVWAHDNRFTNNSVGVSTDSAFPGHPGLPQNHAKFEHNVISDNNSDYYGYVRDGTCAKASAQRGYDRGVVCPEIGVPVGTGVINPGGNYNIWSDNWVYGNHYAGFLLTWVPGVVRADTDLAAQFDTSHHNRFVDNMMGLTPAGEASPNGLDFWWDGEGIDNCWQTGTSSPTEPVALPGCGADGNLAGLGAARLVDEPLKALKLSICLGYDMRTALVPVNCQWFGAQGAARVEVQAAIVLYAPLGLLALALLLWRRKRAGAWQAAASTLLGIAGTVVIVFGAASEGTRLTAIGFLLLGCWWFETGITFRSQGIRRLGGLTIILGVIALLGAVDTGLWMLPWTPISPAWVLLLLELIWLPWALAATLRRSQVSQEVLPALSAGVDATQAP
jgi:hypothetical protein